MTEIWRQTQDCYVDMASILKKEHHTKAIQKVAHILKPIKKIKQKIEHILVVFQT